MIDNYKLLYPGHWFQFNKTGPEPEYKISYSSKYDTYETNYAMSDLRFSLIKRNVSYFSSVCDFGYGNGAFLQYCNHNNIVTYGYDISDYPVPDETIRINDPLNIEVDVMTFYDSLEHIDNHDLTSFLSALKIKYIVISVPWCHEHLGSEYFRTWKHRRENEHFHHFDVHGILNLLHRSGYKQMYVGNDEDKVRKPVNEHPNILTVIAEKH